LPISINTPLCHAFQPFSHHMNAPRACFSPQPQPAASCRVVLEGSSVSSISPAALVWCSPAAAFAVHRRNLNTCWVCGMRTSVDTAHEFELGVSCVGIYGDDGPAFINRQLGALSLGVCLPASPAQTTVPLPRLPQERLCCDKGVLDCADVPPAAVVLKGGPFHEGQWEWRCRGVCQQAKELLAATRACAS
jgi:hypothetical protein